MSSNIHGFDMLFWTKKAKRAKNVLYNDVRDYFNDEKKFMYPTCENWCKKDKDGNVKCK